nr:fimbria/pilus outer membrane usher protein [Trinickia mobilis]
MPRRPRIARFGRRLLQVALYGALAPARAWADDAPAAEFNDAFLEISGDASQRADISQFAYGNRVLPGLFRADVFVGERSVGREDIKFEATEANADAKPCLTREKLDAWGVNVAAFPSIAGAEADACIDVAAVIPQAKVDFDVSNQRLVLSIPQAALKRVARGAVTPDRWTNGITAGHLNYQVNLARQDANSGRPAQQSRYVGLRGGVNVGDWRLRHSSSYSGGSSQKDEWQPIATYLERNLPSVDARLEIGDSATPGDLFEGMQFRGVQIGSDASMLPDSQQGYAPTLYGVARTNAEVTVRQNGYVIYSTFVAPGPFVIDDLYPTGGSGDLEVSIAEADGQVTRFVRPYAALPTMVREGAWRFSATAGQYRSGNSAARPAFLRGTVSYGANSSTTLYGGVLGASRYQSILFGVGVNLAGLGAVSGDVTLARTGTPGGRLQGHSLRLLYAKSLAQVGTDFRVLGYRYSSSGFRTFQEAAQMQADDAGVPFHNKKSKIEGSISQRLGNFGSLYATVGLQSYWGTDQQDKLIQFGYSGGYKQFNYNLTYNQSAVTGGQVDRQVGVSVSIPLGRSAYASYGVTIRQRAERSAPRLQHVGQSCGSRGSERQRIGQLLGLVRALRCRALAGPWLRADDVRHVGRHGGVDARTDALAAARRDDRARQRAGRQGRRVRRSRRRAHRRQRQRGDSEYHAVSAQPDRAQYHGSAAERRGVPGRAGDRADARRGGAAALREQGGEPVDDDFKECRR